jgi:hypothetical protein
MRRLVLAAAVAAAYSSGAAADELSDLKSQLEAAKQMIQQLEQHPRAVLGEIQLLAEKCACLRIGSTSPSPGLELQLQLPPTSWECSPCES